MMSTYLPVVVLMSSLAESLQVANQLEVDMPLGPRPDMGGVDNKQVSDLYTQLVAQNPLHGIFARVFDRAGGEEYLLDFAIKQPAKYLSLMVKMTAPLMPTSGVQGDVNIQINNNLQPTKLDE
jgi:hypothetical protein